jgi:hypothetical protein
MGDSNPEATFGHVVTQLAKLGLGCMGGMLALLVILIGKIGVWLTRASVRQKLEMTTGAILVGLGVGLVFARRG